VIAGPRAMDRSLALEERPVSWSDRLTGWRDGLLMSPGFQRWAAGFPPTRWIARRRARALFDLCAGFVYSQALLAGVRLGLFETLAKGPQSAAILSLAMNLPLDGTLLLLRAGIALRLVERRRGDRYGLGALGAALASNPGIGAMIEHHAMLYADLQDPVRLLRGECPSTELARYWAYAVADQPAELGSSAVAGYSTLMALSQPMVAAEVIAAYPLGRHKCLLDVGGGEGAFLSEVAARVPNLQLMLFDLPAVAERASARFAAKGLVHRARAFGGDFVADALPTGADIVSLVRVLHDHDDATVLAVLQAIRRVMPPDGTLLIAEPMSGTQGAEPVGDAYFGFYLMAMQRGRPRTPEELKQLLAKTGFGAFRMAPTNTPLVTSLLVARPV
jgi:demethylspheroidene O-methyltransferase